MDKTNSTHNFHDEYDMYTWSALFISSTPQTNKKITLQSIDVLLLRTQKTLYTSQKTIKTWLQAVFNNTQRPARNPEIAQPNTNIRTTNSISPPSNGVFNRFGADDDSVSDGSAVAQSVLVCLFS